MESMAKFRMRLLIGLALSMFSLEAARAAKCACATTSVHVRSGAGTSHAILGTAHGGNCFPFKGDESKSGAYEWVHVDFTGKDGWIAEDYVELKECPTGSGTSTNDGCPNIVTRAQWGARPPTSRSLLHSAVKYAFIHHGASAACHTEAECAAIVRGYQRYHMDGHHWNDIGYSFVVGEDGNAYEGRGWDAVGAHTQGYNTVGLGFCIIGNFMERLPDSKALDTVQKLIACGVSKGKIQSSYILRGHRDMGSTACPGTKLYDLIKTWPHY
ncbi:peptidoglycan-recognition protein SC2-like isoform X1 [Haliotis rufescens]|uniref:peptidoglycan-recognition protein SC2-like isoform X1 n=2 Tax=Haliotis rufescens TaxID=6454 RepID=UPI00201F237D|nr:peptidoglycan-recognition protein SC2-like isoform X1 [Haliotis rufescens]